MYGSGSEPASLRWNGRVLIVHNEAGSIVYVALPNNP
jgi:hypothetical protein